MYIYSSLHNLQLPQKSKTLDRKHNLRNLTIIKVLVQTTKYCTTKDAFYNGYTDKIFIIFVSTVVFMFAQGSAQHLHFKVQVQCTMCVTTPGIVKGDRVK